MSENNATLNALDQLLDGTLDDLADVPEFAPFPAGIHLVTIAWNQKTVADGKAGYELKFSAIETREAADPDQVVSKGQVDSVFFFLVHPNEKFRDSQQGAFKGIIKALAETFPASSTKGVIEASNGAECLIVTSLKAEKKEGVLTGRKFLKLDKIAAS